MSAPQFYVPDFPDLEDFIEDIKTRPSVGDLPDDEDDDEEEEEFPL